MKGSRRWLPDCVGFVVVAVLAILCFPAMMPVAFAADETGPAQIKALDGIPEDLAIVYGTGATHAEWGRTTYRISADGKALYEKTRGSRSTAPLVHEYCDLTKDELLLIVNKIRESAFFSLNNHYSDPRVLDGWSSFISVTMGKRTHSVAVMNTRQKEFDEIASLIGNSVDKKRTTKTD